MERSAEADLWGRLSVLWYSADNPFLRRSVALSESFYSGHLHVPVPSSYPLLSLLHQAGVLPCLHKGVLALSCPIPAVTPGSAPVPMVTGMAGPCPWCPCPWCPCPHPISSLPQCLTFSFPVLLLPGSLLQLPPPSLRFATEVQPHDAKLKFMRLCASLVYKDPS